MAFIFDPKIWKRYLSYVVSMENVFSLSYQLTDQTKFEGVFIAGSFGEGIKSICSYTEKRTDFDFMLRLKGYVAVERQLDGNNPNANIVKIEHSERYPGYALLRTPESRDTSSYLSSRHFFTPDLSPITLVPGGTLSFDRFSRHGPALMFEFLRYNFENLLLDNIELDVVVYIHCNEWPSVADEWIERNRLCWPSGTMIADIVDMGCDLVPKGAHGSENQSNEWNISFAKAERHLLHNMSSAQLQTYVLFQIISKKYIFGERFHQIVDSYIFKTTFFWASEENDAMQWKDEHYIDYVLLCLRKLLQFVKEGNCPHFFMRNCNLLRGKLDDLQKRDFIGMLEKFTSIEYYKQTIHSLNSDARSVLYESKVEVDEETLNAMDAGVFSSWEETLGSVIYYALPIPTAQNLETITDKLRSFFESVQSIQSKSETCMEKFIRSILIRYLTFCKLRLDSIAISDSRENLSQRDCFDKLQNRILNAILNIETLRPDEITQIAHLFFTNKLYENAMHIIMPMLSKLQNEECIQLNNSNSSFALNRSEMDSMSDCAITFFKLEDSILTEHLRLEIVSAELEFKESNCSFRHMYHVKIHPIVYAYYMRYKYCIYKRRLIDAHRAHRELEKTMIKLDVFEYFDMNLLGCSLYESGHFEDAMDVFAISYKNRDYHRSILYHIGILLRRCFDDSYKTKTFTGQK